MPIPSNRFIFLEGQAIEEIRNTDRVEDVRTVADFIDAVAGSNTRGTLDENIRNESYIPKTGTVVFDVQPSVTESGSVSYFEIGDIRQAANLLVYMGSPSREFSINGRFVSRSEAEAIRNYRQVQLLRSWRLPEKKDSGVNLKTPSRLKLRGLGDWFNGIHVRIVNLSIEMPEDVDYIRAPGVGKDVPIVWPVSLSLKETRSIEELRQFNIDNFRNGDLNAW